MRLTWRARERCLTLWHWNWPAIFVPRGITSHGKLLYPPLITWIECFLKHRRAKPNFGYKILPTVILQFYPSAQGSLTPQEYVKWLILPTFQQIGFEQKSNDSHLQILSRGQILAWACKLGIPDCVNNATALYKTWMDQSENQEYFSKIFPLIILF